MRKITNKLVPDTIFHTLSGRNDLELVKHNEVNVRLFFLQGDPVFIVSRKRSLADSGYASDFSYAFNGKRSHLLGLQRFVRDNLPRIRISCTEK